MKRINAVMAAAMMLPSLAYAGEETSIEMADVPAAVLDAIRVRFDNVELISANTEREDDGRLVYEIQGRIPSGAWLAGEHSPLVDADGDIVKDVPAPPSMARRVEFDVLENGTFDEIEIEFRIESVPGAVIQALQKRVPGFEPTFIEASYSDSMDVMAYEFEGRLDDRMLDLEVSASGAEIRIADR